jgi:hypothetical protein
MLRFNPPGQYRWMLGNCEQSVTAGGRRFHTCGTARYCRYLQGRSNRVDRRTHSLDPLGLLVANRWLSEPYLLRAPGTPSGICVLLGIS